MPTIELHGVEKHFGPVRALDAIDLTVADGEQLAILGPSGSGKSTLLRLIAGLEEPDGGTLRIGGVDQYGIAAHKRDIAIVFQHFALYPHLSSLDNITLGLRHGLKLPKVEAERRAHDIATRMRVEHLLARKPREMSGGQRQRIALARALARRSGVVLLDEPLSGLDAQLHAALRVEIAGLLRAVGATGINVTHDQVDAMAMADRVAVVNEGKVEQLGSPDELYAAPASTFVASFIGSPPMNLFNCGSAVTERLPGLNADEDVRLGVRPESLRLGPAIAETDFGGRAVVALIEPNGSERVVHLSVTDGLGQGQTAAIRCRSSDAPAIGESVPIACAAADLHVFGGAHGHRMGAASEFLAPVANAADRAPADSPADAAMAAGAAVPAPRADRQTADASLAVRP